MALQKTVISELKLLKSDGRRKEKGNFSGI